MPDTARTRPLAPRDRSTPPARAGDVRVPTDRPALVGAAELLVALSHALDLTEGAPPGHTLRSCVLGMRLAAELGLDDETRAALYYALLLKDAGCSANAARMSELFGTDDRVAKPRMKLADANDRVRLALETWRTVAMGRGLRLKVRHMLGIARGGAVTEGLIRTRCERGADIAGRLGFPAATCDAIRALDEHWNGNGQPAKLAGEAIPLLARICNVVQVVDAIAVVQGADEALRVVRQRSGTWFDPALARRVLGWRGDARWWTRTVHEGVESHVAALEPAAGRRMLDPLGVERVARAFADVVDAKSPFTYRHSVNVSAWAGAMARAAGADDATVGHVVVAGLLHDVGKLGVSNLILDKPGALDAAEREAIEAHPLHTWAIVSRIPALAEVARTAALHHEKLDGSGYPWGVGAAELDRWARVLAVAEVHEALTADRPYRAGIPRDQVLRMLERDRGRTLDGEALDLLAAIDPASVH